jgi:hypothetical protein
MLPNMMFLAPPAAQNEKTESMALVMRLPAAFVTAGQLMGGAFLYLKYS